MSELSCLPVMPLQKPLLCAYSSWPIKYRKIKGGVFLSFKVITKGNSFSHTKSEGSVRTKLHPNKSKSASKISPKKKKGQKMESVVRLLYVMWLPLPIKTRNLSLSS